MRWFRFALISIVLSQLFSSLAAASNDKVYTVGVVPQFETTRLHKTWVPILNRLEVLTGYKFELKGSSSIPEFERQFLAGEFDFAYMNPYHLVWSNETKGYIPLIRDHSKQLSGILVVRKDGSISDINQLQGKVVAFPAPNALGASLMVRAELENEFGIKITPRYVKNHDSVYLNVLLNQTAAGGGVQKTLNQQKKTIKDKLSVLYRTKNVSPHPFAARRDINEQIRKHVQQAILNMGESDSDIKLLSNIPIKQVGVAKLEDYKLLKEMGLEAFRVLK
jgi:phosphonate transport system substrate-binding protein